MAAGPKSRLWHGAWALSVRCAPGEKRPREMLSISLTPWVNFKGSTQFATLPFSAEVLCKSGGITHLRPLPGVSPYAGDPIFFNFTEIARDLPEAGCAVRTASENELEDFLRKTLSNPALMAEMTQAAQAFAASRRRTASRIASILIERLR